MPRTFTVLFTSQKAVFPPGNEPHLCGRCSSCDSLFSTATALEDHKDDMEHWSGDEAAPDDAPAAPDNDSDASELDSLI